MMVLFIELYPFIPLSVTLRIFQSYSSVQQFSLKILFSYPINKQRGITALDRQGTQQQRPESPTVTPPGVRVNTRYINSTKGTSSKKDAPSGIYTLHFRHTRRHRCVEAYDRTNFHSRPDIVFRSRNWLNI